MNKKTFRQNIAAYVISLKVFLLATTLLFCLQFALFLYFSIRDTVNVPVDDDYFVFISSMLRWLSAQSPIAKIGIIIAQHNEY